MGDRKRTSAIKRKEEKANSTGAKLLNCPSSPRKMRLVADLIRGKRVEHALNILKYSNKDAAASLRKVVLSAIANWQAKNEGVRIEDADLIVKQINVDGGRMLKRLRPAPQGRGYRVRKRSNHITLIVDSLKKVEQKEEATT